MKKLALLVSLIIVMTSCVTYQKGQDGQPGKPGTSAASFEILKQEAYGGSETEFQIKVDTQEALAAMYKEYNLGDVPVVDFTKKDVVILFMGQKSNGGYAITVDNVKISGSTAIVTYKVTTPKPGENVTMALTAPYCVAAIPKAQEVTYENAYKMKIQD